MTSHQPTTTNYRFSISHWKGSTPPGSSTGCAKLMQDIPYDIWHYITTFLSAEEVKKLYSVNRSLFSISMDERYRTVCIGPFSDKKTERNITRVADPEISSRVRSFSFKPGHLCKLLYKNASILSGKTSDDDAVSDLVDAFGSLNIKPQPSQEFYNPALQNILPIPAHWAQRNMLKILRQMTSLTSLRVKIRGEEHWFFQQLPISSSFFSVGWSAFGTTLRSLELRIPLEDMAKVLPPSESLPLKSLETLSLQVLRASLSTNTSAIILETLLPLINKHQATLRSLNLDVTERTNFSLLERIEHIKHLESFTLKQPFIGQDQTDLSGLKRFLQAHRSHLTHLSIHIVPTFTHYPTPYSFFAQDCFNVTFPKLQRLSIHFCNFPQEYSEALIPYIHKFKTTLVSLEVSEHRWSLQRLNLLLEEFSTDSPLRDLKISIFLLEPNIFKALADNLPKLNSLRMDFDHFGPEGYTVPPINMIPRFADEIYRLDFSKWKLRDLQLGPLNLEKTLKHRCKLALVNALPNVESFGGLTPYEYTL